MFTPNVTCAPNSNYADVKARRTSEKGKYSRQVVVIADSTVLKNYLIIQNEYIYIRILFYIISIVILTEHRTHAVFDAVRRYIQFAQLCALWLPL